MPDLHFAIVCSSNMNRSMEAHALLRKKGYSVESYGSGDRVKLPAPSESGRPYYAYKFGTPYADIQNDLKRKNQEFYTSTGVLGMLERNRKIKECPEKFQTTKIKFDVVITCHKRFYNQVVNYFGSWAPVANQRVHIVNIDVGDTLDDAMLGSFVIMDMARKFQLATDLDEEIDELVEEMKVKVKQPIDNCVYFY